MFLVSILDTLLCLLELKTIFKSSHEKIDKTFIISNGASSGSESTSFKVTITASIFLVVIITLSPWILERPRSLKLLKVFLRTVTESVVLWGVSYRIK